MASESAIPMIAITKMLPNALGLRPTASAALPPTIPTPTPAPRPAKAKGRNGPKFPASAASIGRVSNMLVSFRLVVLFVPDAHAQHGLNRKIFSALPRLHDQSRV